MWRRSWSFILLKQTSVSWGVRYKPKPPLGLRLVAAFSSQVSSSGGGGGGGESITFEEAKKLMRLVNVEELKMKLGTMQGKEVIGYSVLLRAYHSMGVSKSEDEAATFARVLDQAGVVLLFRDKVYLHPDKFPDGPTEPNITIQLDSKLGRIHFHEDLLSVYFKRPNL